MVIESIRKFDRAVAFGPYEILHPDFISIAPRGSFVVVVFDLKDPSDVPHHISTLSIERASSLNGKKRRRARKRS